MCRRAAMVTRLVLAGFVVLHAGCVDGFVPGYAPYALRTVSPQQWNTPPRTAVRNRYTSRSCSSSLNMVSAATSTMDALKEGIKAVAVGVSGSKPIPEELVKPIIQAISTLDKPNADIEALERLSSFLGTLFVKHEISSSDEEVLAAVAKRRPKLGDVGAIRAGCSAGQLLDVAGGKDASEDTQTLALKLLSRETLSEEEAYRLGKRLFDAQQPSTVLSLCAHILRVRYETPEEWRGLIKAQQETVRMSSFDPKVIQEAYKRGQEAGNRARIVVQLAEPFDGMNRGELLTPLLAQHIQRRFNTVVVSQCGRTSGPKYGQNLLDIAQTMNALQTPFVHKNEDIASDVEVGQVGIDPPEFGWYVDQREVSLELDAWVDVRRNIIKRPFLATSEKFVDTCGASVLVASAFHPSYAEKMVTCAESATDFKACVIVRKGLEGTLGFGLGRTAEVLCSVRKPDGTFERRTYEFGPSDMGWDKEKDSIREIAVGETVGNIKSFAMEGSSGDDYFDKRVLLTRAGLDVGLKWVMDRV